VPYYLAPLWDAGIKARQAERKAKVRVSAASAANGQNGNGAKVPKELREKLKRARGAKALLVDLEQQVRHFVETWNEGGEKKPEQQQPLSEPDTSDDEVVFVGRNGEMRDVEPSPRVSFDEVEAEKLVFDSLEDDHGASFGYQFSACKLWEHLTDCITRRWLVHSIGQYYGLNTWSITVGDPARREAYVGIKDSRLKSRRHRIAPSLPRPLYGLV
jgi:hypothetical protein